MLEKLDTPVDESMVQQLQEIARNTGDLPALPAITATALQMTDDPRVSVRDLQSLIAQDQALTARILKIVNSAMYSFAREVSTLSHAISILGLDTVRSIIVGASVQQLFSSNATSGRDLTTKLFWEHSWGAAVAGKLIAARTNYAVAEEAFTSGLLHDMGKMVLLRNRGALYTEILNEVYRGTATFSEIETRTFGFSHAHVGALLASKWRFPAQLVEAILYHHDFAAAAKHHRLAAITALADRMMAFLGVGFQKDASLELDKEASAEHLKLTAPILDKMIADVQTMIRTLPGTARS